MLTLILLAVVGGGVALLAVSMAESKPATSVDAHPREPDASGDEPGESSPDEPSPRQPAPREPSPDDGPTPVEPVAVQSAPRRRTTGGMPRVAPGTRVPRKRRGQVAVEGRYADVATPALPRRALSFVAIAVIIVGGGVAVAAMAGAVAGAVGELFGNAIG